jgi:hypothetical protein
VDVLEVGVPISDSRLKFVCCKDDDPFRHCVHVAGTAACGCVRAFIFSYVTSAAPTLRPEFSSAEYLT